MIKQITMGVVIIAVAFVAGRLTAPKGDVSSRDTKTVGKEKEVVTIIEEPNGRKTKTIVRDRIITKVENVLVEKARKPNLSIMGLVGTDLSSAFKPIYGIAVSREFVGLNAGAYAMTNGVIGISLGVTF